MEMENQGNRAITVALVVALSELRLSSRGAKRCQGNNLFTGKRQGRWGQTRGIVGPFLNWLIRIVRGRALTPSSGG